MRGKIVLLVCHILNRVPHKKLNKISYELQEGYALNLRVQGCLAKIALPKFKRENVGPKTFNFVFIGYTYTYQFGRTG